MGKSFNRLSALVGVLALTACSAPQGGDAARSGAPHGEVTSAADKLAETALRQLHDGDYDAASQSINQALQLRIDRSSYHLINGLDYHLKAKIGDRAAFDLAEQGYSQAIHFDSSNWLAYYFRGRLRLDTGRFDAAMSDLADALMFRPDDNEVLAAFAYAAYRSARPDIAAGALTRIENSGRPVPASVWRNLSISMAALGRPDQAEHYAERYRDQGAPKRDFAVLQQRLADWGSVQQASPYLMPAQLTITTGGNPIANYPNGDPSGGITVGIGNNGARSQGANSADILPDADRTTAAGTEDKMVVIDVVMISTEETISTAKGVNLLNGLTLEFGGVTPAGTAVAGYSYVSQAIGGGGSSTSVTRAITLPSVSYTLNILNAANQRSEVLSRPTLVGLAGKQSSFFSGQELTAAAVAGGGTVSAGGVSIGGGQAINIDKEIGVKLGVVPTVLEDGRLKMAVNFERTFLKSPSDDVNFTFKLETDKDQITANVIMRYGETLILGGLSEKETQYTRSGVPGLQDVPGLQYFFSNETKSDYQKSTLVLLTPRPPQYIYQPDKAREAYEKSLSEDERPLANLSARYSDWFTPYPNWASVFHHLQENGLYREFRTGDVDLESWSAMQTLSDRLDQALDFLHY